MAMGAQRRHSGGADWLLSLAAAMALIAPLGLSFSPGAKLRGGAGHGARAPEADVGVWPLGSRTTVDSGASTSCGVFWPVGAVALAMGAVHMSRTGRKSRSATQWAVSLKAEASDTVTGTKFEEEDEKKNPTRRPGHQVKGMGEVDPETAARQARVRAHQEGCQRLPWAEEIRTMMEQPKGFAVLSTFAKKASIKDYPAGSIVGFAVDDKGRPIFCFSGMSSHTGNLNADSRASLCVTEPDFRGAADARVVLTGDVKPVPKEDQEAVRAKYLEKHEGAYWVNFGDFTMFRMEEVLDISFVGGFARAGGITPEEYYEAAVDPCLKFAAPVMAHMNDDHESSIKGYIEHLVGAGPCDGAKMKRLDRFGFDVRVKQGPGEGVLRVPFPEPVTERSKIKTAIMGLSKQVAKIIEESKAAATEEVTEEGQA